MKINQLKAKTILILGLGREGRDSYLFLRKKFPKKSLSLADKLDLKEFDKNFQKILKKAKNIKLYLGKNYLQALKKYDVIIKSPGILPKDIEPYIKRGQVITSQTEIFFENFKGLIIGIAGTKGKSTTSSLIYEILKNQKIKAHLVGNIGKPALSFLLKINPDDVFVYELSSHQMLELKKSPKIAVLLNIFSDHLDYYENFQEYVKAEQRITFYQTKQDYLIFNLSDNLVKKRAEKSLAIKIPFSLNPRNGLKKFERQCRIENKDIIWQVKNKKEKIIKITDVPLKGEFYLDNVMAAITVAKILGISSRIIAKTVREFKRLPHRLELIGTYQGIKFYNDSLSVIPETAIAAIEALGKGVETVILGGFERYQNFNKLAEKVIESKIKTIILFPVTGQKIWQQIEKRRDKKAFKVFFVANMKEAVKLAYQFTNKGKICLLSPASPSFGLFKDYKQRGSLFKKWVKFYALSRT